MEEYATQGSRKFRKVSIIIQKKTKRPVSTGRLTLLRVSNISYLQKAGGVCLYLI